MFKLLQKVNIKLEGNALFLSRTHLNYLCTIDNRFQEKNFAPLREIVRKRFRTFRFREQF